VARSNNNNDNAGTERKVKSCSKYTVGCVCVSVDCDACGLRLLGWRVGVADEQHPHLQAESNKRVRERARESVLSGKEIRMLLLDVAASYRSRQRLRCFFALHLSKHTHTHTHRETYACISIMWGLLAADPICIYLCIFHTPPLLLYVCMWIQHTYMHICACIDMFYFIKAKKGARFVYFALCLSLFLHQCYLW